jgi:hypothetical protein
VHTCGPVFAGWSGLTDLAPQATPAADLIINRPFSGKRSIELNIHGSAYYDSGLGGGRPWYNWNYGNGNNYCG